MTNLIRFFVHDYIGVSFVDPTHERKEGFLFEEDERYIYLSQDDETCECAVAKSAILCVEKLYIEGDDGDGAELDLYPIKAAV
jgi:hypothetical protein